MLTRKSSQEEEDDAKRKVLMESTSFYRKACEMAENPRGCFMMGMRYVTGEGVDEKDAETSMKIGAGALDKAVLRRKGNTTVVKKEGEKAFLHDVITETKVNSLVKRRIEVVRRVYVQTRVHLGESRRVVDVSLEHPFRSIFRGRVIQSERLDSIKHDIRRIEHLICLLNQYRVENTRKSNQIRKYRSLSVEIVLDLLSHARFHERRKINFICCSIHISHTIKPRHIIIILQHIRQRSLSVS